MKNYRLADARKKFVPTSFNMLLMNEDGEVVACKYGRDFALSLTNEDYNPRLREAGKTMKPGSYVVMIDPVWHECAEFRASYKDVLIDVYGPDPV